MIKKYATKVIAVVILLFIFWGVYECNVHMNENSYYKLCAQGSFVIDPVTGDKLYINSVNYYGQLVLRTSDHKTFDEHCRKVKYWEKPE